MSGRRSLWRPSGGRASRGVREEELADYLLPVPGGIEKAQNSHHFRRK